MSMSSSAFGAGESWSDLGFLDWHPTWSESLKDVPVFVSGSTFTFIFEHTAFQNKVVRGEDAPLGG